MAACLFMDTGSFIGFTLQPVLKSKNISRGGGGSQLLGPRRAAYVFFCMTWTVPAMDGLSDSALKLAHMSWHFAG